MLVDGSLLLEVDAGDEIVDILREDILEETEYEVLLLCGGQTLHCGHTAGTLRGTCIKDHPKDKEGGNIKHANATTQHNNLILRCPKSVVLTVTNPNCNYAKA